MNIVIHQCFEGCNDTETVVVNTEKITHKVLKSRLIAAKHGDWLEFDKIEPDPDLAEEALEELLGYAVVIPPVMISKIVTVYVEG